MTLTIDEITNIWLEPDKIYQVKEDGASHICKIFFQTRHCFFFCDDKQKVISKTKVDYYVDHNIIKEV